MSPAAKNPFFSRMLGFLILLFLLFMCMPFCSIAEIKGGGDGN